MKIKPKKVPLFKPQTSILLLREMEKMLRKPTFLPGRVKIIQHGTNQPLEVEIHPSTEFMGGGEKKWPKTEFSSGSKKYDRMV